MSSAFGRFRVAEVVIVSVILLAAVFVVLMTIPPRIHRPALVALVRQELMIGRQKIQDFRRVNNRYPQSLAELEQYIAQTQELRFAGGRFVEQISTPKGNATHHERLDGTGGWYYDNTTGELRVNLTHEIKSYLPGYIASDGTERPCDW
jgi:hypothetical protein